LPEDFKYPDRMEAIAPNAFVAPRLKIPFPVDIAIQDLLDIMNKKMRGFIYGWVEYDDVFTSSARRRTEFCVEIEVIGNPLVTPSKGAPESRQARGRRLLWALLDPEDITQPMKIASTNQAKNRQSGDCPSRHSPLQTIGPPERPTRSHSLHGNPISSDSYGNCHSAGKTDRRRANGGSLWLAAHRTG
jgi:hypothetical protein